MKKLNATNAIAVLSLGLILSVFVAGCGGNDSAELAVTKNVVAEADLNGTDGGKGGGSTTSDTQTGISDGGKGGGSTTSDPKTGISDGGKGGGSTTSDPKTGISDGGTGESATVSDSELLTKKGKITSVPLTPAQLNALTSAQWEEVAPYLTASQVASIPLGKIKNLSAAALIGLSAAGTQAVTVMQMYNMSDDQLEALIDSGDLTDDWINAVKFVIIDKP